VNKQNKECKKRKDSLEIVKATTISENRYKKKKKLLNR
jgi:hypothetical protein